MVSHVKGFIDFGVRINDDIDSNTPWLVSLVMTHWPRHRVKVSLSTSWKVEGGRMRRPPAPNTPLPSMRVDEDIAPNLQAQTSSSTNECTTPTPSQHHPTATWVPTLPAASFSGLSLSGLSLSGLSLSGLFRVYRTLMPWCEHVIPSPSGPGPPRPRVYIKGASTKEAAQRRARQP